VNIPLSYSYRNLVTRRLTTALTAGGMALVVFVFAAVLMLAEGLRQTLVATGSFDNAIVLRASAESEVQSILDRDQTAIVMAQPEIALNANGNPLVDRELIVLFNLRKRGSNNPSNVTIRGVSPTGLELRPEVKLAAGRMFRPGSAEIVTGKDIAQRFAGAGLGETLQFAQRDWTVEGEMDDENNPSFDHLRAPRRAAALRLRFQDRSGPIADRVPSGRVGRRRVGPRRDRLRRWRPGGDRRRGKAAGGRLHI